MYYGMQNLMTKYLCTFLKRHRVSISIQFDYNEKLVHSMNFVSVKMHDPPKIFFLHEIDGTHPNDTQ